jgi:hypothetical protein
MSSLGLPFPQAKQAEYLRVVRIEDFRDEALRLKAFYPKAVHNVIWGHILRD